AAAARLDPRPRRRGADSRLHANLVRAARPLVVGRAPGAASRDGLPAELVPAQPLRLRLLGAPDDRRALRRLPLPAEPPGRADAGRAPYRRRTGGAAPVDEGLGVRGPRPRPAPLPPA